MSVSDLCRIAGVARSGYYKWLSSDFLYSSRKELQDRADFDLILEAFRFRGYDKGVRGIYMRFLHTGIRMNHKKIRRIMRKYGLQCPIRQANPYRRMAKAMKTNVVADNALKREFKQHGVRSVLLTDITYIRLNEGFCYLSVIIDAYTMQVLAHVLSESIEVDFVLETVRNLIRDHGTSLDAETLIHSDQGCHYTSVSFRTLVSDVGLRQSMSRRGNCWDNAPQESFFGHMKDELKKQSVKWKTFEDVSASIEDWIDYYNKDRYQMGLLMMSPDEFYLYKTQGICPAFMLQKYSVNF